MTMYEPILIDKRYYTILPLSYRRKIIEEFRQYYMDIMLSRVKIIEKEEVDE